MDTATTAHLTPKSDSRATFESRRNAVVEALREAIDICLEHDGHPDECIARLAEAEDRFNRRLAREVIEALQGYAPRITSEGPIGRPTLCVGDDPDRTPMKVLGDGSIHFYDMTTGIECESPIIDHFAVLARSPCHSVAPRYHLVGALSYPLGHAYTGRHPVDEARMWSSWWMACVDGLTMDWDTLVSLEGPRLAAPMDARFCKGGLTLARLLLDIGARRADIDVRSDLDFQSNWETSVHGRGNGPAPPRAWATHEEGIPEHDHERCHWAALSKRGFLGDDYLTQRVRVRLDRWHLARAMLVTVVALLERLYNTHAIYTTLRIGALESTVIERDVPRVFYDGNDSDNDAVTLGRAK